MRRAFFCRRAGKHPRVAALCFCKVRQMLIKDGKPCVVLTCTQCLRSFPFAVDHEPTAEVLRTPCIYCPNAVSYIIDFSRSVNSPEKRVAWKTAFLKSQRNRRSSLRIWVTEDATGLLESQNSYECADSDLRIPAQAAFQRCTLNISLQGK